jgi:hypothetical protein
MNADADAEEFIDVNNLNINYDSPEIMEEDKINELDDVYQLQPILGERNIKILHVGILNKVHDVIINRFDLSMRVNCILISCIYTINSLQEIESGCRFPICKIIINHNDGVKLSPICTICLNYHTFEHKQNNKSISEYVSNKDDIIKLYGYYSISLNYDKKITILETIKEISDMNSIFSKMIKYIKSDVVQNILKEY